MPAPGQYIETEFRGIRELDQEDFVRRYRLDRGDRKRRRQRMKAVENDPDRSMVGAAHDFPGVAIVVDMATPGQRLEANAQGPRGGALAKCAKISRSAIDAAVRGR
jgi:hypothetical protein